MKKLILYGSMKIIIRAGKDNVRKVLGNQELTGAVQRPHCFARAHINEVLIRVILGKQLAFLL